MHVLPPLTDDSGRLDLPLLEGTAERLVAALLHDRAEAWSQMLHDDPALSLWTARKMQQLQQTAPRSIADMADWLRQAASDVLRWPLDVTETAHCESGDSPARRDADPCIERTAQSVAVGWLAGHLARQQAADARTVEFARLLGQLECAGLPYVSTCCGEKGLEKLRAWLAEAHTTAPLDWKLATAAACQAKRKLCDEPGDEHVMRAREHGRQAAQRGLGRTNGVDWSQMVPAIIKRVGRWHQLERDFAGQLQQEKLAALKELAYGASHEINNPLANISTRAQSLLREEQDPERRRKLATISAQAFRAHEMISDMMLFAKPPTLQRAKVELYSLLEQLHKEILPRAQAQQTELAWELPAEPTDRHLAIDADPVHLAEAVKALCQNSLEALVTGGRLRLAVQLDSSPAGTSSTSDGRAWTSIIVEDNGPGLSEKVRQHLFDPYFSGREAGRGLGLGLSKCWTIVKLHGGRIDVQSQLGRGATFTLQLPLPAAASHPVGSPTK